MQKLLPISFVTALLLNFACACVSVTVPNVNSCHVTGEFEAGCTCAESNTGIISYKTFDECLDMILAQPERPDPEASPLPQSHQCGGVDTMQPCLPMHAAAVIEAAADWMARKTAMEKACRGLGKNCTYEMKQAIQGMRTQAKALGLQ